MKLSKHSISVALFWYIWIFKVYSQYHLTFINPYIVFFLQWRVHLDGIKMKIWFPSQSLSWGFRAQHLKNFVRVPRVANISFLLTLSIKNQDIRL